MAEQDNKRAWLRWSPGRRETGYFKMFLAGTSRKNIHRGPLFAWDIYVLKFPPGSCAPEHTDEIPKYRHYRLNFIIKRAKRGGAFESNDIIFRTWRLNIFRSDAPHSVSVIEEGTRYVLSLGIVFHESLAHKPADE